MKIQNIPLRGMYWNRWIPERKTIPLKERQQERGMCTNTILQTRFLQCLLGQMGAMLFLVVLWCEQVNQEIF